MLSDCEGSRFCVVWRNRGNRPPYLFSAVEALARMNCGRAGALCAVRSVVSLADNYGGPAGIRTLDTRIKSPMLYQAELQAHKYQRQFKRGRLNFKRT